jgi:N-acetylglucosamine-6-phosphate deacetylase
VIPGLIDCHTHGGIGVTFGSGDASDVLNRYSTWAASGGVTGFLCSLLAPDINTLIELVKAYVEVMQGPLPGAEALGIHLEGPFLNPERKGAFTPSWLRSPAVEEARAVLEAGQGWIRQATLAPELPGAEEVAVLFRKAGVVVALGHSNADYETARRALGGNFSHVTHTYNAQSGFDRRRPGVVGAVLSSDRVTAELIADTLHVHPAAMKVLVRCLGKDRVVLITDAMAGAGLPDGDYQLIGVSIRVQDGKATLPDGTLAGSTATLIQCVCNLSREAGIPLVQAVRMASLNPARLLGLSRRLGRLAPGKDANLSVIDLDGNVFMTMVKGKIVYQQGGQA